MNATTDAEDAVIGAVLIAADVVLAEARDLRPDDFQNPHNRQTWEHVLALADLGEQVTLIAVADRIRLTGHAQDARLMAQAAAAPLVETIGQAVRLVREASIRRAVMMIGADLVKRAQGGESVDTLLAQAREAIAGVEIQGTRTGPAHVADIMGAGLDAIEDRQRAPERHGIQTGIWNYDATIGPLGAGNLITIGGPPGGGKTGLAIAFADHAAALGIPTCYFSLEMATQEILERFLARRSRVNGSTIRRSTMDQNEWRQVMQAGMALREAPLWIDARPATVGRLVAEIRRWHAKHVTRTDRRLGLVVVDYVQLLQGDDPREEQFETVSRATRLLKQTAAELAIPIVELSQLNRESQKRGDRPTLAALKGSGTLEADSDVVIFPWRELKSEDDRNQPGYAKLIVAKNRFGPSGNITAWWQADLATFTSDGQEVLPV